MGRMMAPLFSLLSHHPRSLLRPALGWCGTKGFLAHVDHMLSRPVRYARPCGRTEAVCSSFLYSSCTFFRVCLCHVSQSFMAPMYFSVLAGLMATMC